MAVPTQLIKDALPLVRKGGPGMIKTVFRDFFNSIAGNEGSSIAEIGYLSPVVPTVSVA